MQSFKFNLYKRLDGVFMLYVNSRLGVALGISEELPLRIYMTKEKDALQAAVLQALGAAEGVHIDNPPDFEAHPEGKTKLWIGDLYVTDVANVGGCEVLSDGIYLYAPESSWNPDGPKLINLDNFGDWWEVK